MYLFWLCWVLSAAHRIFSCSLWTLTCGMWDLIPCSRNDPILLHCEWGVLASDHQCSPCFIFFFLPFLAMLCGLQSLSWTEALSYESMESQSLYYQGIPYVTYFWKDLSDHCVEDRARQRQGDELSSYYNHPAKSGWWFGLEWWQWR